MIKFIGDILLCVVLGILLSWSWVAVTIEREYNPVFIAVVAMMISFMVPIRLLKWIYKEELAKLKSERPEE